MKRTKMVLALLMAFFAVQVAIAQSTRNIASMAKYEAYDGMLPTFQKIAKNQKVLDKMVCAFEIVESNGNTKAYNKRENSCGILAIRPIMIDEANRLLKVHDGIDYDYFEYEDRWDKSYSELVFHVIMVHKNPKFSLNKACLIWNKYGGKRYIDKVTNAYKNVNK